MSNGMPSGRTREHMPEVRVRTYVCPCVVRAYVLLSADGGSSILKEHPSLRPDLRHGTKHSQLVQLGLRQQVFRRFPNREGAADQYRSLGGVGRDS